MAQEIRALTGMRGVAAVFVVVFHEAGEFQAITPAGHILRHGYNMVDLFFVLSGFVMTMTYGHEFRAGTLWQDHRAFLGKRLARIYPLYFCLTVVTFFLFLAHLSGQAPDPHLLRSLPENLLLVQTWGLGPSIVSPAWSISTEWAAYLVFPLLLTVHAGGALRSALGILLSALSLTFIAYMPAAHPLTEQGVTPGLLNLATENFASLVRCVAGFAIGIAACRWKAKVPAAWATSVTALILIAMAFPATDLLLVGLFALLVMSLSNGQSGVARLLASRQVHRLGVLSYSIYLLHARFNPVRAGFARVLAPLGTAIATPLSIALTACTVVLAASVTYALIEQPGRNIVRGLLNMRRGGSIDQEPTPP